MRYATKTPALPFFPIPPITKHTSTSLSHLIPIITPSSSSVLDTKYLMDPLLYTWWPLVRTMSFQVISKIPSIHRGWLQPFNPSFNPSFAQHKTSKLKTKNFTATHISNPVHQRIHSGFMQTRIHNSGLMRYISMLSKLQKLTHLEKRAGEDYMESEDELITLLEWDGPAKLQYFRSGAWGGVKRWGWVY